MPIYHHFVKHIFTQDFSTRNAILERTPYDPQLLILGTYNPQTLTNQSDFFYHRNYFWPTLNNLFKHNKLVEMKRREDTDLTTPTQHEILLLCQQLYLTFADLIECVLPDHVNTAYTLNGNVVTHQGTKYNLIEDKALEALDKKKLIRWSTSELINYLKQKPSIRYVRFTRQPTGVYKSQWEQIVSASFGRRIDFGSIHSPSGQGLREKGVPMAKALARRWLFHSQADQRLPDEWVSNFIGSKAPFNY